MAKFRKLGGKSSTAVQIYTSSKNSNQHPHILLIQFCSQLHPFSYFEITSSPEIAFIIIIAVIFVIEISVYSFFLHLTSLTLTSFATSYPLTENKFGHPVVQLYQSYEERDHSPVWIRRRFCHFQVPFRRCLCSITLILNH